MREPLLDGSIHPRARRVYSAAVVRDAEWHRSLEQVAIVVDRDAAGNWLGRSLYREEADAINAGTLASPNLYYSLAPEAKRILVRVFEKHCCHEQVTRSMMAEPNTK